MIPTKLIEEIRRTYEDLVIFVRVRKALRDKEHLAVALAKVEPLLRETERNTQEVARILKGLSTSFDQEATALRSLQFQLSQLQTKLSNLK